MDVDLLQHSFEDKGIMAECAAMIAAELRGARFDPEVHGRDFFIRIGLTTKKPGKAPTEFSHRIGIHGTHQEAMDGFVEAFKTHNGIT